MRDVSKVLIGCALGCKISGDDPYTRWPCVAGHARVAGFGCEVGERAIAIDGDAGDWEGAPTLVSGGACMRPPCGGLLPSAIEAASFASADGFDRVALHVRLDAAPRRTDPTVRYVVRFRSTPDLAIEIPDVTLAWNVGGAAWSIGGIPIEPVGVFDDTLAIEWTADGFEYQGYEWPPVRGAADIAVWTERLEAGAWMQVAATEGEARVCWYAEDPRLDPCREVAP